MVDNVNISEESNVFVMPQGAMSTDELIAYLDDRNYLERKQKVEYHEQYCEGSISLDNEIIIDTNTSRRFQVRYREYDDGRGAGTTRIEHLPEWAIILRKYKDEETVNVICRFKVLYFSVPYDFVDDYVGEQKGTTTQIREYKGSASCPLCDLSKTKLEELLETSKRNVELISEKTSFKLDL